MLWVSKFGIANGEAAEDSPWVGAFPDPARNEESSDLYVIVHPALPGSEEFCSDLRDAIGRTFHKTKVSLTGGLLRALKAAHENLRDWNERSMREHQIGAGASVLAIRGREAYLGQAGPSSAIFYRDFAASEIVPALPEAQGTLGVGDEIWPQFTRYDLVAGDRLVILTPGLVPAIGEETLAAALELPPDDALKELFRHLRQEQLCGAVLIAAESEPAKPPPETKS
ncbi:MAG: hypothetical protein IH957_01920 [Chloroflexi bacterium]|nr:hypothetical protein [Chloroflexota bacterium]